MSLMFDHPDNEPVLELNEAQCWKLLENTRHGRLAFVENNQIEIFPLNFVTHEQRLYFRTAPGSKLAAAAGQLQIAFEADGILPDQGWSVVCRGGLRLLEDEDDIAHAASLGVAPWIPTFKDNYVEITVDDLTGRHFIFGRQPERGDTGTFQRESMTLTSNPDEPGSSTDTSRLSR